MSSRRLGFGKAATSVETGLILPRAWTDIDNTNLTFVLPISAASDERRRRWCRITCPKRGGTMGNLLRTGLSLERDLLERFDEAIYRKGYQNRSEAVRDLIREHLVQEQADEDEIIVGTLTMVYGHHRPKLSDQLLSLRGDKDGRLVITGG